jgi:hypothetical protein
MSHVVHSGASGKRNVYALFFMLGWHRFGFNKKHEGSHYAKLVFLHTVLSVGHVMNSGAFRAQNIIALFFTLGWDWFGLNKKRVRTHYAELVFLHHVGYAGHVVHSDASWAQNFNALFFILMWDRFEFKKKRARRRYLGGTDMDSTKSMLEHVSLNSCFCIRWDLWVTSCILVRPGRETSKHYFLCSGGTGTVSKKSAA